MNIRGWLPTFLALLVVLAICGMAMRATKRDNECSGVGGHIEGMYEMECVTP